MCCCCCYCCCCCCCCPSARRVTAANLVFSNSHVFRRQIISIRFHIVLFYYMGYLGIFVFLCVCFMCVSSTLSFVVRVCTLCCLSHGPFGCWFSMLISKYHYFCLHFLRHKNLAGSQIVRISLTKALLIHGFAKNSLKIRHVLSITVFCIRICKARRKLSGFNPSCKE
jgi:hypothetical protein